jgi:hypothetical protein
VFIGSPPFAGKPAGANSTDPQAFVEAYLLLASFCEACGLVGADLSAMRGRQDERQFE